MNNRKQFLVLQYGFEPPTPEIEKAWGNWFASIADWMVDIGSPLVVGPEISHAGTKELRLGMDSLAGYSIISAESLDEAEAIAKDCPMISSVRVYEAWRCERMQSPIQWEIPFPLPLNGQGVDLYHGRLWPK